MALDTSKINLQGVGTLSANAIMVEGSNPSSSFNVVISIPSEGQNWSCETVTLSNVSSLSGTTTLNIRANSGFQVNASMFTALGFIGSSTYFTNVTFSNTSSIIDTANEVLVTIEWATQSISEDINIQFNGIVTTEALQGVNYFNTLVNITHPGATAELFDVSEGLDVSTLSSQADSTVLRLEGSVPEPFMSATTQIFKLRLTISEAGFTYSDHPEVSISSIGNSYSEEQYNITTSQSSGSEQVMFAYYQPNLYLNNGVGYQDHINIYATAFGQQVTIINEDSGNQQNYFHVTDDIPDNGVLSQTSSVGIISHGYVIGEIHAFSSLTTQTPSNYANWITNIQYNPSVLNNYSGTISFTVADNTTIANRSAYFTVFDGGSITPQTLTTFQVEQSRLSFVSFTVSTDTLSDALGGNILTNSNLGISVTDEVLILPTKSCTFDIVGVIEIATDFNSVPGAASGAEGHIENNLLFIEDSIGDSTNNSWATIDSVTITGSNTFNASVSINANSNNGDPQRGVYIKFKHPLDPDNISTIEVEQQRAFDPALDTLTVRKQETSGSFISQDGLLVPYINEDEGYYVDGDLIPSGTITKESTDTITMLQIQVGDNGLPLIDLPKVKIDLYDELDNLQLTDNQITTTNLSSALDTVDWLTYVLSPYPSSDNYSYSYVLKLTLTQNSSYTNVRKAVISLTHPNEILSPLSTATVMESITLLHNPEYNAAFYNLDVGANAFLDVPSESTQIVYNIPLFSTLSKKPVVKLERMLQIDQSQSSPQPDIFTTSYQDFNLGNNTGTLFNDTNGGADGVTDGLMDSFVVSDTGVFPESQNKNNLKIVLQRNTTQTAQEGRTVFRKWVFKIFPFGYENILTSPANELIQKNQYTLNGELVTGRSLEITQFPSSEILAFMWNQFMVGDGSSVNINDYISPNNGVQPSSISDSSSSSIGIASINNINTVFVDLTGPDKFRINTKTTIKDITTSAMSLYLSYFSDPVQTFTFKLVEKTYIGDGGATEVINVDAASDSVITSVTGVKQTVDDIWGASFNSYVDIQKASVNAFSHAFPSVGSQSVVFIEYLISMDSTDFSQKIRLRFKTVV